MRRARRELKAGTDSDVAKISSETVWASKLNFANTLIQGAILFVMIYGAISVNQLTARHFQWQRAAAYVERLNSDQLIRARATFDEWRKTDESVVSLIARGVDKTRGKANSEKTSLERIQSEQAAIAAHTEQDLRVFVNFLQELALAMKHGTLDELYTWDNFGAVVTRYGEEMKPYIEEIRIIRNRALLYEDIFTLAAQMRELDRKLTTSSIRK